MPERAAVQSGSQVLGTLGGDVVARLISAYRQAGLGVGRRASFLWWGVGANLDMICRLESYGTT